MQRPFWAYASRKREGIQYSFKGSFEPSFFLSLEPSNSSVNNKCILCPLLRL